ncbi:MAG: GGDEF domain-containing protein [Epsilonproteobacteria bacterium]|nr:GGDEF domain-containing protein [Campylobacterota bacterium]
MDLKRGGFLTDLDDNFSPLLRGCICRDGRASYSFDVIRDFARELHSARYEMILKKSVIDETIFKEEQSSYATSTLSPRYVWDKYLHEIYDPIISKSVLEGINTLASKEFEKFDRDGWYGIVPIVVQDRGYLVSFDPLFSFDRKEVGYIITYMSDHHLIDLKREFKVVMMMVSLIIALVSILILYFVYRIRTQHDLLVKNANTDQLTQIANRAYLILQLNYMLKTARRNNHPLSLIFMDIDHFKLINDTYGHRMGDGVLVELSIFVSQCIRESDIFGRWGGEEFVIILPNTGLNEAIMLAEKLRMMVESHQFDNGHVTCSFGVAQMIDDDTKETLINRADRMLYVAKEDGRNRVRPKAN